MSQSKIQEDYRMSRNQPNHSLTDRVLLMSYQSGSTKSLWTDSSSELWLIRMEFSTLDRPHFMVNWNPQILCHIASENINETIIFIEGGPSRALCKLGTFWSWKAFVYLISRRLDFEETEMKSSNWSWTRGSPVPLSILTFSLFSSIWKAVATS